MAPRTKFGLARRRPVAHFNDLPDHCLSIIFGTLPLKQLFSVPLVCRKWNYATVQYCHSVDTLLLSTFFTPDRLNGNYFTDAEACAFFGLNFASKFTLMEDRHIDKDSSEPVKYFNVDNLVKKFPNIVKLGLFKCNLFAEDVAKLLAGWTRLVELQLVKIDAIDNPYEWELIFGEIAKQIKLRKLSIYLERYPFPLNLVNMKHLIEFHLGIYDFPYYHDPHYLYKIWSQLSPQVCSKFSIGFFVDDIDLTILDRSLEQLAANRHELLAKLTRVRLPEDSDEILPLLGGSIFPSIQYLDMVYKQNVCLHDLEDMSQVSELILRRSAYEKDYNFCNRMELDPANPEQMKLLPRMPNVRRLQLCDFSIDPAVCRMIFPNAVVETIRVSSDDADSSNIEEVDDI